MPKPIQRPGIAPAAPEVFREFAWRLAGALAAVKHRRHEPRRPGVAEPRTGIARPRRVK